MFCQYMWNLCKRITAQKKWFIITGQNFRIAYFADFLPLKNSGTSQPFSLVSSSTQQWKIKQYWDCLSCTGFLNLDDCWLSIMSTCGIQPLRSRCNPSWELGGDKNITTDGWTSRLPEHHSCNKLRLVRDGGSATNYNLWLPFLSGNTLSW